MRIDVCVVPCNDVCFITFVLGSLVWYALQYPKSAIFSTGGRGSLGNTWQQQQQQQQQKQQQQKQQQQVKMSSRSRSTEGRGSFINTW
jgi:hypothetical protein